MANAYAAAADVPAFIAAPVSRAEQLGVRFGRTVGTWLFSSNGSNGRKEHPLTARNGKEHPLKILNARVQPARDDVSADPAANSAEIPPALSVLRVGTELPIVHRLVQQTLDDRYRTILVAAVGIGVLWRSGLGPEGKERLIEIAKPLVADAVHAIARLLLPLHLVDLLVSAAFIGAVLMLYRRQRRLPIPVVSAS